MAIHGITIIFPFLAFFIVIMFFKRISYTKIAQKQVVGPNLYLFSFTNIYTNIQTSQRSKLKKKKNMQNVTHTCTVVTTHIIWIAPQNKIAKLTISWTLFRAAWVHTFVCFEGFKKWYREMFRFCNFCWTKMSFPFSIC